METELRIDGEISAPRNKSTVEVNTDSLHNLKLLDDPWHYAEAYHLLMLSQNQLIQGNVLYLTRLVISSLLE